MQEFFVDLADAHDAASLHAALAAQLPLPEHYGRNLDAFYDVLTEFGCDWRIVFRNAGPAADGLRDVCRDAAEETEGLEVVFEGTSPDGRVRLNKKSTVGVDREYAFGTDSNSGLKNGDLVTVRVDFGDSMESFNQNLAAQYKTVLCEWTRDYVVEGLPYSLTEFSQIDEPTLDVIKDKAVRTITGQAEQKEGLVVVEDIKLIGHCFLTRKSPTSLLDTARNYLFLVYSVKCSVDLSKDGHDYKNTVNYVTSVRFSNLLGMPDGKTALSLENAALPTSTIKLNTGVPTLLVFLPRTFEFAGYEDTNTLFYNEIAPLTDRFTCEDNIGTAGEAVTIAN